MDKSTFLARDFEQVSKGSDDAVFEMLQNRERQIHAESSTPATNSRLTNGKAKKPKQSSPKQDQQNETRSGSASAAIEQPSRWGKPIAVLNTRVPEELAELIDDMVYQSKKEKAPMTKQAITIRALIEFFAAQGKLT